MPPLLMLIERVECSDDVALTAVVRGEEHQLIGTPQQIAEAVRALTLLLMRSPSRDDAPEAD